MNRLKSVQHDTKRSLNEFNASKGQAPLAGDTAGKSKRMSVDKADGSMSELNSLYAVVQEIKKDLSHMSTAAQRSKPVAVAASPAPEEPS